MLALWLLATLMQDVQVSAEADRDRLTVGDAVTYTVRAIVAVGAPVQITLPAFDGFSLIGRAEHRESLGAAGDTEVYVVELRLRAQRLGLWRLGPLRVTQGIHQGVAPEVEVAVEGGGGTALPQVGPRVLRLLQRAPPPKPGDVAVSLLVSADTALVGEQVDVVTVAWFPRELLGRLRRPPTIRPPSVDGVYSAVQPSAAGVAVSRVVGGVSYDLYVAHQIVFPVDEGTVRIPGAGLAFSVPAGRQYFSDEKSFQLTSEPRTLVVRPLPGGGPGPLARDLSLAWELRPEPARAGDPIPVFLVLSGFGNSALWQTPAVRWPDGSRGYADAPEDHPRITAGLVGGTRRYRFAVIADSAGTLVLPDVWYRHFDPDRGTWREALARSVVVPVQPAAPLTRPRSTLPALDGEPWSLRQMTRPLALLTGLLLIGPPVIWAAARRRRRGGLAGPTNRPTALASARLERLVRALVPDPDDRRPERLPCALREVGLGARPSDEAARVYHLLATARFDPAAPEAPNQLEAEAEQILRAWPRRASRLTLVALAALWLLAPAVQGQELTAPAGEVTAPVSARAWYLLGAEAFAAGQEARAAASWLVAHRLAPRSPQVNEAWRRVSLLSADLQRTGRVVPVTPVELLLLGALGWAGGWMALIVRRRRVAALAIGVGLAFLLAAVVLGRVYARPLGVVARAAALRQAPHGLAEETGRTEELTVVAIVAERAGWRLVRTESGMQGWMPEGALAEVRGLDFWP